jgi:spore coat protein CotH
MMKDFRGRLAVLALVPFSLAVASRSFASDPAFDQSVLHDTRIEMDPADWRALRENFRENQYYAADVTIDGETVPQAGIRSRGSASRNDIKPALKVDFNKYVAEQEFRGYKTLVLDNLAQDPSMLRERLAFQVFEAMGLPAPQNAYTRLTVNGTYWGVYALVEPVSKPFLKSRLGQESGNLFDYEWGFIWDFSYRGPDEAQYVPIPFQPQTNEDHLDAEGLVDFVRTVNEAPDEALLGEVSRFLDLEQFLTYLAVENALAESDGFLGNFGVNNFYLYQYGGESRFQFIPWDKDNALSDSRFDLFLNVSHNVLARRLLADPELQRVYVEAVVETVTSYVNPSWLGNRADEAYKQIRLDALRDEKKPYTNEDFELGHIKVKTVIFERRKDVMSQVR